MDLTTFIDVDPQDPESFGQFLDMNALAHQTVHNALLQSGVVAEQYPMWTDDADHDWREIHYAEHITWNVALGITTPPDLVEVDFENEDSASDWLNNHSALHLLVNQALSL